MPIQQHLMGSGGSGGSVQLIGVNRFNNSDSPDPIPQFRPDGGEWRFGGIPAQAGDLFVCAYTAAPTWGLGE